MKKDYEKYLIYSSFVIIIALLVYVGVSLYGKDDLIDYPAQFQTVSSGTTDSGDVSIELTPRFNNNKLEADIKANTHSVDLSQFDLSQITALEYNNKIVKPISAPKLESHHPSGALIFQIDKDIKNFKITINGIPKNNQRVFIW